ncbi:thiamine biosynthesis lipoprotein [Lachnotalea glycerini]|uniref:FAD:protein FMN transferase n=1 Tax=Lachnotalea glycerini TaxID=1763509 RepID=A0A318F266_9FIRM|nr:FAD:protein FMN transferase [Lachnotalea glycerini]PXV95948.1 thiamine biosynthesis lipoprotein [Lachnotalea glycerini]
MKRKLNNFTFKILLIGVITWIGLTGCSAKNSDAYTSVDFAMGTVINQTIYADSDDTQEVLNLIVDIEDNMLSWRIQSSEIAKINAMAGVGAVNVSDDVRADLLTAIDVGNHSDGALDITIGKISRLWDIEGDNPKVPRDEEIQALLKDVDFNKLIVSDEGVSLPANSSIDLGAIGKGIACDKIKQYFDQKGNVDGAVISVGGSILVYKSKPDSSNWKVGITDPRGEQQDVFAALSFHDACFVSTSGDYEKYFIQDGKRYHHILDPKTGYPSESGLISVTIVSDSGVLSDALSTACFILGYDKSLPLLEYYDAEAIFVDSDKNVMVSQKLKDSITILKDDYKIIE